MSRPVRRALVVALVSTLAAPWARATPVDWRNAGSHVGERVSIEGDVAAARVENNTCVLEFDTADAGALRVRLLLPMVSSLPPRPERLYLGKRVVVTGTVRRFLGKLEMVVNSPGAIEVMGVAGGPGSPPAVAAPDAPDGEDTAPASAGVARAPEPDAPPPLVAAPPLARSDRALESAAEDTAPLDREPPRPEPEAAAPAPAPSAAPSAPAEPVPAPSPPEAAEPAPEDSPAAPLIAVVDPCRRARDHWAAAAYTLREGMDTLARCLDAESYACRASAAALAPALTDLEWAEQRVESACPH
jgi:hypothetical protein